MIMGKNPFGDDRGAPPKANPFGETEPDVSVAEAATRIDQAARKIRNLRSQLGAEGLSIPATRELIDEIAKALEASASALRQVG
jgi:flagellin-like hook-associated protein FlgL